MRGALFCGRNRTVFSALTARHGGFAAPAAEPSAAVTVGRSGGRRCAVRHGLWQQQRPGRPGRPLRRRGPCIMQQVRRWSPQTLDADEWGWPGLGVGCPRLTGRHPLRHAGGVPWPARRPERGEASPSGRVSALPCPAARQRAPDRVTRAIQYAWTLAVAPIGDMVARPGPSWATSGTVPPGLPSTRPVDMGGA